jgi:hypothetical protein
MRALLVVASISLSASAVAQQPDPQSIQRQLDATQQRIQQLEHSLAAMEQPPALGHPQPVDPFATKWPPDLHQTGNLP